MNSRDRDVTPTSRMTTHAMFAPYKSRVVSRGGLLLPLTYLPGTSVGKKITRPARSPRAGPGQVSIIVCGPGAGLKLAGPGRDAWTGLVSNNCAGCGPGLGLTYPGLGRARAYSESHYYFNIMVKDYLHLSIAIRSLFSML